MTAQGHPRVIFQRAIERGNLTVAEATLRAEIPRPTPVDLLEGPRGRPRTLIVREGEALPAPESPVMPTFQLIR